MMVIAGSQTLATSRTSSEFQLFGRTGGHRDAPAAHDYASPQVFFVDPVVSKVPDTTIGYHAGFALRARLVKSAGLGFRIRYAHATADLPPGSDKVGGLQVGAGLALVF